MNQREPYAWVEESGKRLRRMPFYVMIPVVLISAMCIALFNVNQPAHAAIGAATIMGATISNQTKAEQQQAKPVLEYRTKHRVICYAGTTIVFNGEVLNLTQTDYRDSTFSGIDSVTRGSVKFFNMPCITRLLEIKDD